MCKECTKLTAKTRILCSDIRELNDKMFLASRTIENLVLINGRLQILSNNINKRVKKLEYDS